MASEKIISVAPMEGVTTFPMRIWLQMSSQPTAMTSPFLRVTRSMPERQLPDSFIPELIQLRGVLPYQLIPQFISGDPDSFLRACSFIPEAVSPVIEINCGCPSPNSLGKMAGSGMLADPESFARTIARFSEVLGPGRLAVKMRLGLDRDAEFPALLQALADLPLARLTVHARTRADGYRGHARWAEVQKAAETSRSPVHASGDLLGLASWQELQTIAPSIQGAMIGRGLMRNPWIFSEIRQQNPVRMSVATLINALFCYLLLQELWLHKPEKLIARVAHGRVGLPCDTDFGTWEGQTIELSSLALGLPFLLLNANSLREKAISPQAYARLRMLWAYLRSSLSEPFARPSLMRCKQAADFFEQLFLAAESLEGSEVELLHQPAWDQHFAGARG